MKIEDIKFKLPFNLKPMDVGVRAIALVIFTIAMYFNFRDKDEKPEVEITSKLNAVIPDPETPKINDGKLQQTPRERAEQSLDISLVTQSKEAEQVEDTEDVAKVNTAYKSANQTVANFYNRPTVDHEKIRMQAEIEELKAQMRRQNQIVENTSAEDQLAIIERSYELAAKYSTPPTPQPQQPKREPTKAVSQAVGSVVSSLTPIEAADFTTAVGGEILSNRNTITACIESDQTIVNSGAVRIRLLETIIIGDCKLPKGAVITGQSRVSSERLNIKISQVESRGRIIPIDLKVLDTDGAEGIFIPNSTEVAGIKQIVANMSSDTESSLSISTQSVGADLLTDLGKSAISGVADYAKEKVKEVKVHLKAGYNVMLYQGEK
ncbi:MAG: conjugative transposon protein TraM [Rikenellaceae bacterium]